MFTEKYKSFYSLLSDVTVIEYVEGTIIKGKGEEIRIYIHKKYWDKLKQHLGKTCKLLIIIEE